MAYVKFIPFSICMAISYYVFTLLAIGLAAAGKILWWFSPSEHFQLYHITQNFIGIALAALIPTYLVYIYQPNRLKLCITVVILGSVLLHGNTNYIPVDPNGFYRFFYNTVVSGDIGSYGVALEIIFLPILWLLIFEGSTRNLKKVETIG